MPKMECSKSSWRDTAPLLLESWSIMQITAKQKQNHLPFNFFLKVFETRLQVPLISPPFFLCMNLHDWPPLKSSKLCLFSYKVAPNQCRYALMGALNPLFCSFNITGSPTAYFSTDILQLHSITIFLSLCLARPLTRLHKQQLRSVLCTMSKCGAVIVSFRWIIL